MSDVGMAALVMKIRAFPFPLLASAFCAHACGCTFAYAPLMSGDPLKPFVLKFRNGNCAVH